MITGPASIKKNGRAASVAMYPPTALIGWTAASDVGYRVHGPYCASGHTKKPTLCAESNNSLPSVAAVVDNHLGSNAGNSSPRKTNRSPLSLTIRLWSDVAVSSYIATAWPAVANNCSRNGNIEDAALTQATETEPFEAVAVQCAYTRQSGGRPVTEC